MKLTPEEVKARDLRMANGHVGSVTGVAELKAEFKAAEVKRNEDGVIETKEDIKVREADEAKRLAEAKGEAHGFYGKHNHADTEKKFHTDARDLRVSQHKANVETARLARLEREKTGVAETPGAKLDREEQEALALEEVGILHEFEPIAHITDDFGGNMNILRDKINEIVKQTKRQNGRAGQRTGESYRAGNEPREGSDRKEHGEGR